MHACNAKQYHNYNLFNGDVELINKGCLCQQLSSITSTINLAKTK